MSMLRTSLLGLFAVALLTAFLAPTAHAESITFEFWKGGNFDPSSGAGLTGSDSMTGHTIETGAGNNDDWWQTNTSTAVVFTDGASGLTISASAKSSAGALHVYGDTHGENAGLGVFTSAAQAGSGDNITTGEHLILAFNRRVSLETTHFGASHGSFGSGNDATFILLVDGTQVGTDPYLRDGVGGLTGRTFEFVYDSTQFYVSGATASPVPEPVTLSLMGAGLLGLVVLRRRKWRTTA